MHLNEEDLEMIENLLQKYSIDAFFIGVRKVCDRKAEHYAIVNGSITQAKQWAGYGNLIELLRPGMIE